MAALGVSTEAAAQIAFTEVAAAKGINGDTYRGGLDHALGPSWIDYNDDGLPDLFLTNGIGFTAHLFRNDGGGNFTRVDNLLPALPNVDLMDATFGDYDDDGDPDIYISTDNGVAGVGNTGPPNILLRNLWVENGGAESTPLFEDVAPAAGVDDLSPDPLASPTAYRSTGASFVDYDRDGYLDLYVCHWPRNRGGNPVIRDRLYHNNGDGTFEDVTASAGLDSGTNSDNFRPCLASVAAHLDQDRWPDLWIGNTSDPSPYHEERILQNRGDGTFVDRTADSAGVGDDAGAAMAIGVADIELDGDWDVYITDLSGQGHDTGATPFGNPLYLGTGNGIVFQDDTAQQAGIVAGGSWGVNFLDADNDGYEDLYVGMMGAPDRFFGNDQDGTFTEISVAAGFSVQEAARGSAFADFDMDGDLDIAMVPNDGELVLYENQTTGAGNWLQLKLRGAGPNANGSNRDAIGALVIVEAGGLTMMRQVTSGSGHGQDSGVLHFGLDTAATADAVTVYWPSGRIDEWAGQAANVRVTLNEDTSGPRISGPSPGGLLAGASTTVDWVDGGSGATDYSLQLGTSIGASDVFDSGALGTNTTVNATGLPTDGTTVYATLNFDISGTPGSVSYEFTAALANQSPTVAITGPASGIVITTGTPLDFTGTADDAEDGNLDATIVWASSTDGALGTGVSVNATLSRANHTVSASVTDSGGVTRVADVIVIVQGAGGGNTAPAVSIDTPADGAMYSPGTLISFSGTATDTQDGDLAAGLTWTSDLDGAIGSTGSFDAVLSDGTHSVIAEATDAGSLTGSDSITVHVGNIAPTVTLVSPLNGASETSGTPILFEASASDPEDGDVTGIIDWTSSIDGSIGTGGSFSATLSDGTHQVTAEVTDSGSLMHSRSATVTIGGAGGPPVEETFFSVGAEDGTVAELMETNDVGGLVSATSTQPGALRVGDDQIDRQYKTVVSFDTSSLPDGAVITSAVLRLYRGRAFGTTPYDTHGPCSADIQTGGFGGDPVLAPGDFEAAATAPQAAVMSSPLSDGDWSEGSLDSSGLAAIDRAGTTQARIECAVSDDDDATMDQVAFSGGEGTVGNQPELVVTYVLGGLQHSVARQWNDELLGAIRTDFARPTVHARNLYHVSAAMWDAWAAYDGTAGQVLHHEKATAGDVAAARDEAISYASYRLLSHRFATSPGAVTALPSFDAKMDELAYDRNITSTAGDTPAELGNRIAATIIAFGLTDGANEANGYINQYYLPVNAPLAPEFPGNPELTDPDRWQPLAIDPFVDQAGQPLPGFPEFLGPEWGIVTPFSLSTDDLTIFNRDGFDYWVYHDPGAPPPFGSDDYRTGFEQVVEWSGYLDPTDGVMIDIGPGARGNNPLGTNAGTGHALNPATGLPYEPNMVPAGDYYRVLAEFWADGPASETPPGHWFTLANYVSDHPQVVKQWGGTGPVLDDLEWDVRVYLAMGGTMHDVAIAAWGAKGWYDYIRPVSAIRYLCDLGQSSDILTLSYHPDGIALIPGVIELVNSTTTAPGAIHEHLG